MNLHPGAVGDLPLPPSLHSAQMTTQLWSFQLPSGNVPQKTLSSLFRFTCYYLCNMHGFYGRSFFTSEWLIRDFTGESSHILFTSCIWKMRFTSYFASLPQHILADWQCCEHVTWHLSCDTTRTSGRSWPTSQLNINNMFINLTKHYK